MGGEEDELHQWLFRKKNKQILVKSQTAWIQISLTFLSDVGQVPKLLFVQFPYL